MDNHFLKPIKPNETWLHEADVCKFPCPYLYHGLHIYHFFKNDVVSVATNVVSKMEEQRTAPRPINIF